MKCSDALVATALTSAYSEKEWQRFANLMAATLPLAASRIRGFLEAVFISIESPAPAGSGPAITQISKVMSNIQDLNRSFTLPKLQPRFGKNQFRRGYENN